MKAALRFFTIVCYFLPFAFFLQRCNGFDYHVAYNQTEADSIMKINLAEAVAVDTVLDNQNPQLNYDTAKATSPEINSLDQTDSAKNKKDLSIWDKIITQAIFPKQNSISAIGAIWFYKTELGSALCSISILLSLVLLFYKFIKSVKVLVWLNGINLLTVGILFFHSMLNRIELLWGFWILFLLLIIQFYLALNERKNFSRNK